jgi:hypothetical protein
MIKEISLEISTGPVNVMRDDEGEIYSNRPLSPAEIAEVIKQLERRQVNGVDVSYTRADHEEALKAFGNG